jgi:hypothetical protein
MESGTDIEIAQQICDEIWYWWYTISCRANISFVSIGPKRLIINGIILVMKMYVI